MPRAKSTSSSDKPKKTVERKAVKVSEDVFYQNPYDVVERVSLNFFDPVKNSNKFYQAEVHQSPLGFRYYYANGRVGQKGVFYAEPVDSLQEAISKFNAKKREKLRKGYVETDLATVAKGSLESRKQVNVNALGTTTVPKLEKSSLPKKVADLVKLIYTESSKAVSFSISGDIKTDATQPLGNFGINGINRARRCIQELTHAVRLGHRGVIESLSIEYFRNVPRALSNNLRKSSEWLLDTHEKLSRELDILDLFEDALRMLPASMTNNLDTMYQALNCDIVHVTDKKLVSDISRFIKTTKARNHRFNLETVDVFEINQRNAPQFDCSVGNVVQLFHGSRNAHLLGILSTHLKLPTSLGHGISKVGAMFGDGIYFANNSTKSANYSFASFGGRTNNSEDAFLFIADVAIGRPYEIQYPKHFTQPPRGYDSVIGKRGSHLINDEIIVYNPNRIRLRYLVKIRKTY